MASALGSLKTETGLLKLNALLADRTYIAGTGAPTGEDFARAAEIHRPADAQKLPHVCRWHAHITALRQRYPDGLPKAAAAAGKADAAPKKAAGKEKKELVIDCAPRPVKDRRTQDANAPSLGAGATCFPGAESGKAGRYYVTTAINYANGWPHIGHGYEGLTSDAFARFHRMMGEDVFFMTGADEHGQKIAQTAEAAGMTPIQACDQYCEGFKALNQRLLISNDFYVRTTAEAHKVVARQMWEKCKANGDIYLGEYEGWYNVREEKYITETEAAETDYKDPASGVPYQKVKEASFFFRLSKYQDAVIKHIEQNEEFVQPQQYRGEMLERLKSIELRDLSISRGTFAWGVTCPEELVNGKQHVMYVWFDALINYMSGVHATDKSNALSRFWPAQMHVIGKDICWFHTVIWPAMLMSAGCPVPKSVVVHGMISGTDGRKMSKSFGNVVDPHDLLDALPVDTVRWYLCREAAFGDDLKFSLDSMKLMHNAELCDNLGNLVNRAVSLCGGAVPDCAPGLVALPFSVSDLRKASNEAVNKYRLSEAADLVIRACGATNKWIADLEPWKMKEESQQTQRTAIFRTLLEAIYVLAHFFAPFIPQAADAIFKKLGTPARPMTALKDDLRNMVAGTPVTTGSVLFAVQEVKAIDAAEQAKEKAEAKAKAAAKAEAKPKAKGKAKAAKVVIEPDNPDQPLFSKLDIRVGKVVKAWHHPDADSLFVEEIDVGDPEGPRQVISGLRAHYSLEQFQGRKLLAVCNLMPAKLRGVASAGMVLCAKQGKDVVELLDVPEGLAVGTRVLPQGVAASWKPVQPEAVKEYKIWEAAAKELRTNKAREACFSGTPLVGAYGTKFLAPKLADSEIS